MVDEPDVLNIPAFQRAKDIAKKEKAVNQKKPQVASRTTRKTTPRKQAALLKTGLEMITCGTCEGYFEKIEVGIIRLTKAVRKGDIILIEKSGGLFQQEIKSMQIDRKEVKLATTGSEIGLKLAMPPQIGGKVYKIIQT